jgi:membrane-associated protein
VTAELLDYLALYGVPAAALVLALGQFGIPMPTSLALLAIGALAANGDADLAGAFVWALAGCVLGDQAGFAVGRLLGRTANDRPGLLGRLARKSRKAEPHLRKWGGYGVFLTRWLFTPLGPPVNLASGATGLAWPVFTLWGVAGEAVWVTIYIGLGFAFGANIEALADILGNITMALALIAIAGVLGWRLAVAARKRPAAHGISPQQH